MSKNIVPSPCNSETIGTGGTGLAHPRISEDLLSSVPNISPRPPVFFVTTGQRQVLNYSFQTGEEFTLEFMQDRANTKKHLIPTISDGRSINTNFTAWRQEANVSGNKPPKELLRFPSFNEASSEGSNCRFPQDIYAREPTKMKFLCNFGGRFLPRPIDGMLRYVGGEKHLIQISQDMSWQGLTSKTTKLIRQAHTIKYHLPGEQVNVLISVSSGDDVHHMIDECIVLEESKERPVMYLFTDEDDEHHVHFVVGSASDEETEAQYIALINGYTGSGKKSSAQGPGSASASDLNQLMFDIDDEGSLADRSEEASAYIRSKSSQNIVITVSPKASRGPQHKMPPSFRHQMSNQDCVAQNDEVEVSSYPARKSRNIHSGSSVPSESTYPAKWEQTGGNATARQQPELQVTATNLNKTGHYATRNQERASSRRELLIPPDDISSREPSPNSNYSSPMPLTSRINKLTREQTEPIIQFIPSNNSSEFQKLMLEEPVGTTVNETPLPLSGDPQKLVYNCMSTDDTMIKTRRHSPKEDRKPHSETDQFSKSRNIQLHNRAKMPDPSQASRSNESGAPILWHNTMYITQDQLFVANNKQKVQPPVPDVMYSGATKKDYHSRPMIYDSEVVPSPHPFTSSDNESTELQRSSPVHASWDKDQASPSSEQQDVELSTLIQSQAPGTDDNSMQVGTQSEEGKQNAAEPTSDLKMKPGTANQPFLEDLHEMGSGAFGTVFHGRWKGTDVAIKRIKNSCFVYPSPETDKLIKEFWREAAILSKLHHPNVLAFYGIVNNGPGGTLATVTEFMVSGSLKKVLLRKDKFLDRHKRIILAMDVAIGMEYLHSKNIIHFDLKCDNLLVNLKDPSRPICKVADFGLSKVKQTTMVSGGMRGTLPWMAPETLAMNSSKVSDKVDVYSFGIVMWEILTGQEPYAGMNHGGVIGGILSNTLRPPVPASCDPEWRKLMEQCWSNEPEKRPSFTEVTSHLRYMLEASQIQPRS